MNTSLLISTSLKSLNHHKGRSLLTMLGIIIGIAAIIAILAIGNGAAEKARRQILAQGNNYMFLHTGNWLSEGKVSSKQQKKIPAFTHNDLETLKNQIPTITKTSPFIQSQVRISYHGSTISCYAKGGNENIFTIIARKIKRGSFFNHYHFERASRVIVLGEKAAKELFKLADPIGKTVHIAKTSFTVVGVLQAIDSTTEFQDPNFDVFMPLSTFSKQISHTPTYEFSAMVISSQSMDAMPTSVRNVKRILRARHRLEVGEPDDFFIYDQGSMMKAAQAASGVLNLLLIIIAAISLLVGGIGVMNIMMVSVTERTKEIGIRMALGAPERLILRQFLIEALIICLIGGIIGVGFGIAVPHVARLFTGWEVIITLSSILIAFASIFVVGIVFGYYPARKASKLSPIEALLDQ